MTLAEATQRLVELHDATLKHFHDTIREHKCALHGLIEQAQEELTALARPVAVVCEQVARGDVQGSGLEAGDASPNIKRRGAAAISVDDEGNAVNNRPVRRGRGRPAKQRQPPAAVAEDDAGVGAAIISALTAGHDQQACSQDSEQPSVSATVRASALEVAEVEVGDDATSLPIGGTRLRATRSRAAATCMTAGMSKAAADLAAPARSGSRKRAAGAAAPSAGCSTRSTRRRGAAAAEAVLPAIEEEEKEMQEVDDVQHVDKAALTSPAAQDMAAANDKAEAAADLVWYQAEQGHLEQGPPSNVPAQQEPAVVAAASAAAADVDAGGDGTHAEAETATDKEALMAATGAAAAAALGDDVMGIEAAPAVDDDAMQAPNAGDDTRTGQGHQQSQHACPVDEEPQLGTAAAGAGPPKTPGFSLRPSHTQQADTPCLVLQPPSSAAERHSMGRQQQSLPAEAAAAAPNPAVDAVAEASGPCSAPVEKMTPGSVRKSRRHSCLKAPSLSFGEGLQGALLQEQHRPADTIGPALKPETAAAAGTSNSLESKAPGGPCSSETVPDGGTAQGAAAWKTFVSSMHVSDAPTPAAHRSRQRTRSGASAGGCGGSQGSAMQAAAVMAADGDADGSAAGASSIQRRSTRASAQRRHSPLGHVISEAKDTATAFAMEQEHQPQCHLPVRTPSALRQERKQQQQDVSLSKLRTPRSARRSKVGLEAALEAAAAEKEEQDALLMQHQQRLKLATSTGPAAGDDAMQDAVDDEEFVDGADWVMGTDPAHLQACNGAVAECETVEAGADISTDQHMAEQEANQECGWAAAAAAAAAGNEQDRAGAEQGAAAAERLMQGQEEDGAGNLAGTHAAIGSAAEQQQQQHHKADNMQAVVAQPAAAAAAARGNLVSGVRSFVPLVAKKDPVPPVAAGKVKVKVKALEAALAAKQAEEGRAQEKAARQRQQLEQQQQAKARTAASTTAAEGVPAVVGTKPQATPAGAAACTKIAAVERAAAGLSGSGGAVRVVVAGKEVLEGDRTHIADKDAAQKRAEKDAEAAKRAMDKAEREERMKRAEQKRKEDEAKRRAELAEKQRLKLERAAAAVIAAKGQKAAAGGGAAWSSAAVGKAGNPRAAGNQAADGKAVASKQQHLPAATTTSDGAIFKTPAPPKASARTGGTAAAAAGGGGGGGGGVAVSGSVTAADGAVGDAAGNSPSLTIKILEPVSTGGKATAAAAAAAGASSRHQAACTTAGAMGPPAPIPLGSKTPASYKTPAPATLSDQERRNIEVLKSSPYVNPGSKRTPAQQPSYMISPFRDDDEDTPDRSHKPIPDWARSQALFEAVKAQQHKDPDAIFGQRQTTCDLGDMFADVPQVPAPAHHRHKVRKLGQRSSSADWSQDRLTWQEEISYKKALGYL